MGNFFFDLRKSVFSNLPPEEHTEAGDALEVLKPHLASEELRWSLVQLLASASPSQYSLSATTIALHVATILAQDFSLHAPSIATSFLFQPYANGLVSDDEIASKAPRDTQPLLQNLLKVVTLLRDRTKETIPEEMREIVVSAAGDVRVIFILIAYRLFLLRRGKTLLTPAEARTIAQETSDLFIPLTHKLGIYAIKGELEDLSLKFTEPEIFQSIKAQLGEKKASRDAYMRRVVRLIEDRLESSAMRWGYQIKARTKSIYSVYNKMRKKAVAFDDIYDLSALRVIIDAPIKDEQVACWYVYSIVTDLFEPNPKRLRDWVSMPKKNGYQSLQITVKGPDEKYVEVQIRTERMDQIAEHGVAAHWRYKGLQSDGNIDDSLAHARKLLEEDSHSEASSEECFTIAKEPHIYVFTPHGKPIKLPPSATVLDFAFAIHTNIGSHARSGKVNGQNVALKTSLKSGDTVEIVTDRNQAPSKDWLQIVVSSAAKRKILRCLREKREGSYREVREQIDRRLKNRKIPFEEKIFIQSFNSLGYKDYNAFYTAVNEGKCDISKFLELYEEQFQPQQAEVEAVPQRGSFKKRQAAEAPEAKDESVLVAEEHADIYYELGKCCSPQYGDAIFAYPSRAGIRIHRYDCPNARDIFLHHRDRVLPAYWSNLANKSQTNLYIEAIDTPEVTARILSLCKTQEGVKLLSYNIVQKGKGVEGEFTLEGEPQEINALRNKLLATKGIFAVSRA